MKRAFKIVCILFSWVYFINLVAEENRTEDVEDAHRIEDQVTSPVEEKHAEETPEEDLFSEHGIVERILLIYEEMKNLLDKKQEADPKLLLQAATMWRSFVEDYHEKIEENYIFPLFEKHGEHAALVRELRRQHTSGRSLTDILLQHARIATWDRKQKRTVLKALDQLITMYRFHTSREDTNIFPQIRKLISQEDYEKLGEQFEAAEESMFGKGAYKKFLQQIEQIERKLGIFDIAKFTPIVAKK